MNARATRVSAVLVAVAIGVSACGPSARVVDEVAARRAAEGAASEAVGRDPVATGPTVADSARQQESATGGPGTSTAGQGPAATGGDGQVTTDAATDTPASNGPPAGDAGQDGGGEAPGDIAATDVGVTDTTIKIGATYFNGGYLDKYSQASEQATRAYINLVNDQGGINGRQVELITCDTRGTVNGTQSCVRKLVEQDKVFLMGPSLDFNMGTVVPYVEERGIPWVGSAGLEDSEFESPVMFPTQLPGPQVGLMMATFAVDHLGAKSVGVSYLNKTGGPSCLQAVKDLAGTLGYEVRGEAANGEVESDLSGQVTRIREADPDAVLFCNDAVNTIKFIQAADRQNYAPPVGWIGGFVAADDVPPAIGPPAVGMYGFSSYAFYDADTPGTNQYRAVVQNYYPNAIFHFYSQANYVGAQVMVRALAEAGSNLTREHILEILRGNTDYDTGMGLRFDFSNPGGGTPSGIFLQADEDLRWQPATDRFEAKLP